MIVVLLLDSFSSRATRAGAVMHDLSSVSEIADAIGDLLRCYEIPLVAVSPDVGGLASAVADGLSRADVLPMEILSAEAVASADVGISLARLGIAETGSIVVAGNDLGSRLVSMLPQVHVVLLDRAAVVATLVEAGETLRSLFMAVHGRPVRYASIITGPSRTADVEKTLSVGVHGPRELHILLVEGLGVGS